MLNQTDDKPVITMKEQLKKFAIKGMVGFQTVMIYGMGRQLGIFNYLYEKSKTQSSKGKVSSISFNLEELSKKLNLDLTYLDGWLHNLKSMKNLSVVLKQLPTYMIYLLIATVCFISEIWFLVSSNLFLSLKNY